MKLPPAYVADLPPVTVGETLGGAEGIVDLWCFFHERADDEETLAAYSALLSADERDRHRRFLFERDRRLFLATRALVRTVLSRYASVSPEDWRFGTGEHGKPYVSHPPQPQQLHFNLSNTAGLVACAVSVAHEKVGIDVEAMDRRGNLVRLAETSFSSSETRALREVPADLLRERFFSYWTLKESYIKAKGMGLALPLDAFSLLLDEGNNVGVVFDPTLDEAAARWRFARLRASRRHLLAVAVDTGGAPLSLRALRVTPLLGEVPFETIGP
jgi:4'-phosphopantetheinyl transferase